MRALKTAMAVVLAGCGVSAIGSEFAGKYSGGTYDFWSPATWSDAIPTDGAYVQLASYAKELTLNFSKDVELAINSLDIKCGHAQAASGNGNRLVFDGDGRIFGAPDYTKEYAPNPVGFMVYRNTDGSNRIFLQNARDSVDKTRGTYRWTDPVFTLDGFSDYSGLLTFVKGDYNFYDPNGTAVNGGLTFGNSAIRSTVVLKPGVSLKAPSLALSASGYPAGQATLVADGATVAVPGDFSVSAGAVLSMTNGAAATLGKLAVSGGETLVAGEATKLAVDTYDQTAGTVTFSDGAKVTFSSSSALAGGTMVVTNGAAITSTAPTLREGGVLHLAGGSYRSPGSSTIGTAYSSGTTAKLWVTGGDHRFEGGDTFIGRGGNTEVLVEGGSLFAHRFRMGQDNYATKRVLVRQTGGVISTGATSDFAQSGILLCFSDYPCEVRLEGGETQCSRLRYRYDTVSSKATFVGDGGTLVPSIASTASSPFMCYLGSATIGAKGLTFDNRVSTYIRQDLANAEGAQGELRFTGGETTSYEGANTVTKTVLAAGTLKLATAATTFATDLSVDKGATFSLEGAATTVTLDALTVDSGAIRLDPGDVITVKGAVRMTGLVLDWASAPADPSEFLVVEGEMDEKTEQAIQGALSRTTLAEGQHISVEIVREAGKVSFRAQAKPDVPIAEGDNVTWTGASGSDWSSAGNWNPSAPTAANRAVFGDAAQKSVALGSAASVGALRFTADGYRIGGEKPLTIAAEQGAAEIAVTAGSQQIAAPVRLESLTAVPVAEGSSLVLAGSVVGGGLTKTGTGALTLGGENRLYAGFESEAGVVTVTDASALACGSVARAHLTGGTLAFGPAGEEPMRLVDAPLVAEASKAAETVVFDVARDVELDDFAMDGGVFFKRGTGTMTVNVTPEKPLTLKGVVSSPNQDISTSGVSGPWSFPADGSAPVGKVNKAGFNVVEGKVVLQGVGTGAKMAMNATLTVGGPVLVCAAQPELVLSNLTLTVSANSGGFWSGSCVGTSYNQVKHPVLRLMDGSVLKAECSGVQPGYGANAGGVFTYVVTGGSTLDSAASYLVRAPAGGGTLEFAFTNSNFFVASTSFVSGRVKGDFCNSFFGSNAEFGAVTLKFDEAGRPAGEMFFHDGSVFCCTALTEKDASIITSPLTFAFDNAEWRPYRRNDGEWILSAPKSQKLVYETRGAGLVLAPAKDSVIYTIAAPLTGEGGLIKRGAGTVAFNAGAYAFSGVCRVEEGVVDLSAAGALANARFGGPGTVKGATLTGATLRLEANDDWSVAVAPTFADCSLAGTLRIDFGRDETHPLDMTRLPASIALGKWTGSGAKPTKAKIVGTGGHRLSGNVTVEADGGIRLEPFRSGLGIIVR